MSTRTLKNILGNFPSYLAQLNFHIFLESTEVTGKRNQADKVKYIWEVRTEF